MSSKRKTWEEAIRWFLWMRQHKAKTAEVDVFNRWQSLNSEHRKAYREIESVWDMCDSIDDLPWPLPEDLARDAYDGGKPIALPEIPASTLVSPSSHQLFGSAKATQVQSAGIKKRFTKQVYAYAASLVVILATGLVGLNVYRSGLPDTFETAVAEQRTFQLDDGSSITLGAQSKLSVHYTDSFRQVSLHNGEAYFEVSKDPVRPFIVDTGKAAVQAIGTAFNINKRTQSVVVSVLEGVVKVGKSSSKGGVITVVEALEKNLTQGQQAIYQASGEIQSMNEDAGLVRASSWRQGNLAFVNERLDRVIQDVNRYSATQLVIGDQSIAEIRFTGTVLNQNISQWVDGLVKTFPIRLLRLENQIVLLTPLKAKAG